MVYKESEYTVDEVLFVFYEYFKAYEDFLGYAHPPIRVGQIKNIIDAMPDFDPLTYPELIAQHFLTEYNNYFAQRKLFCENLLTTIFHCAKISLCKIGKEGRYTSARRRKIKSTHART